MNKILIVEDDWYLQRDLKEILENNKYNVITSSTVGEAIHYVRTDDDIDLYLLDVWLPDGEGFEICREIRRHNAKPVIFLTASDDEENVVKGLNMGGDDYVVKPFRLRELLSRIGANIRRNEVTRNNELIKAGGLLIDITGGAVSLDGQEIFLRPVEYRLLLKLVDNAERIVKRELLLECLWDGTLDAVEDNTLSVHMSRLRGKIGRDYIDTIRGFGYRFNEKVKKV